MIKAIVVEDEWYNLEEIAELVENTGVITVEKKYSNPLKVIEEIHSISPQVAFVDIDMPEMDGITLAERLMEYNPKISIVFITAYNEYAVKAFDVNALDYIMKPINLQRFNTMIEKIKNRIGVESYEKAMLLEIKCFGGLNVSIDKASVKWERSKAEELFALLLINYGNYVHKDIIIEYLWPEYEYQKALQILQTTVYKTRKIFADLKEYITIDYNSSRYCMNIKNANCDYIDFEKAISNFNMQDKSTYEAIESAGEMFKAGFLIQQSYIWSIEKNEELKKKLVTILKEISEGYFAEKNYEAMIRYLKLLAKIVPYEDDVNYMLLKAMKEFGKPKEMLMHYQWLQRVLKEEYDNIPSERIVNLLTSN